MTAPTPSMPSTWAPGALIPGTVYRIIRPIGQGGMGEVYEVEHDMLGTRRALKVLVKHYAGREDLAERLRVEARGLARLKHPNLVEVYDLGTAGDGRIFFAMELLDGVTLRAMLRDRGRLSVRTSVELIVQVLAGLQSAHSAGILHRDVKPENIFVCRDGTVKLLDFGVAKAIDAWLPDQQITARGMTVGTPRYMSPEQAEGAPVDTRTDVYATGQVLWEMLAGRPAFEQTDLYELAQAKWKRGVLPLSSVSGVDAWPSLCTAVDQACQPDPKNRFATALAFMQALRGAMEEQPVTGGKAGSITQAFVAPGMQPVPGVIAVREIDAGAKVGTVPVSGAVAHELTERVDAICPVDRDERTEAREVGPRPKGPSGTELLPAVAARRGSSAPSEPPRGLMPSTTDPPPNQGKASTLSPQREFLGIPLMSWIAGAAAFFIPVMVAAGIGYWQLSTPRATQEQPVPIDSAEVLVLSEPVSEPVASAVSEPAASAVSEPAASAVSELAASAVSELAASTAAAVAAAGPPPGMSAAKAPASVKTVPPPLAATPKPSPVPASPPPPPTRKMPSSGL